METYRDENTNVILAITDNGDILCQLYGCNGKITNRQVMACVKEIEKSVKRGITRSEAYQILREEIIIQCVTDWIKMK